MHGGAPGNCVLTARRIVAIYPSKPRPSNHRDIFRHFSSCYFFLFSFSSFFSIFSIDRWIDRASGRLFRPVGILNPLIFYKLGSIMGEASRVYRANPRKAGSAYTGHSRGTYAIWHSICEWIRCLATQTTAIGFHLMNRGPEREREPSEAFLRRGHGSNCDPTPAPATLVLHSLPATCRLDDSPQCRPTELCTRTIQTRYRASRPPLVRPAFFVFTHAFLELAYLLARTL